VQQRQYCKALRDWLIAYGRAPAGAPAS
jgi:hypothetical protein